ncbi:alpha/beta fold hydrolase [Streptomonospora alba]|uniref:alpha/beta fold hydrolase n=1 Tax=Streptomonospora alba TaxID=183763 RepID=UPI000699E82C|nr:alpha/beta fold hydrolase [Streptomonospora alba]
MEYILVHGTTQSPRGWDRLAEALVARGHRPVPVDLLAGGTDRSAEEYADLVAEQVAAATAEGAASPAGEPDGRGVGRRADDGGNGPTVVVHSGAGALAAAVAARVGAGRVVWLAAFVPDTIGGRSLLDEMQASPAQMFNSEWTQLVAPPTQDPVTAGYFLFHDGDLATLR